MSERILVVDDDDDVLVAAELLLKRHFSEIVTINDPAKIHGQMAAGAPFDVVLLDMNFSPGERSGREGLGWLANILEADADAVVVSITAHSAVETAVEAIKLGAIDFIAKPWHNEKLIATVQSAIALRKSRRENAQLRQKNRELVVHASKPGDVILGHSEAIRRVFAVIERAAPTDANVLITGENGTGKELVAREIHRQSNRSHQVFISIDLGAISESLASSELFGHVKGAFTGADEDRIGRFAAASGGTLFLDEIGNIPRAFQAKLLTALERREVVPVGSNTSIPIDVRIISATNLPRAELGDDSTFRQDLLYRLNTVEIELPRLAERCEDIDLLAEHFMRIYARKYDRIIRAITPQALEALRNYHWPGNVRALRHALERAVILAESDVLQVSDFSLPVIETTFPGNRSENGSSNLATTLAELEKLAIREALRRHTGNISRTAKELGISRMSLYRRMAKYGL